MTFHSERKDQFLGVSTAGIALTVSHFGETVFSNQHADQMSLTSRLLLKICERKMSTMSTEFNFMSTIVDRLAGPQLIATLPSLVVEQSRARDQNCLRRLLSVTIAPPWIEKFALRSKRSFINAEGYET